MTALGTEPATFWLVAQCLNHLRRSIAPSVHQKRYNVFLIIQYTRVRCICLVGHEEGAYNVTQHVRANAKRK